MSKNGHQEPETILANFQSYDSFGEFAAAVREAKGLSKEQLAAKYGCRRQNVDCVERPGAKQQAATIEQWGKALDIPPEQIALIGKHFARSPLRPRIARILPQEVRFGAVLGCYMDIRDEGLAEMQQKTGIDRNDLFRIIRGLKSPDSATMNTIAAGLGFRSIDDFFEQIAPQALSEKMLTQRMFIGSGATPSKD